MLSKELYSASPCIVSSLSVVNFRTRIVEKRVISSGIDVRFDLLTEFF